MQKVKFLLCAALLFAVLLLDNSPVQAQSQTGTLVAYTKPGAEVLIGCGDVVIGGLANAQGVFTHDFPIGPNCVNSLGVQKHVIFVANQITYVFFGHDLFLPLIAR